MASSYRDRSENQIDPFNAPDPIMPGGEQTMDPGEAHGGGLERFSRTRAGESKRRHTSHHYQAPREHADAYEAPSTDGTPGTVAAERARHAAEETKRAAQKAKRAAKAAAKTRPGQRAAIKPTRVPCQGHPPCHRAEHAGLVLLYPERTVL